MATIPLGTICWIDELIYWFIDLLIYRSMNVFLRLFLICVSESRSTILCWPLRWSGAKCTSCISFIRTSMESPPTGSTSTTIRTVVPPPVFNENPATNGATGNNSTRERSRCGASHNRSHRILSKQAVARQSVRAARRAKATVYWVLFNHVFVNKSEMEVPVDCFHTDKQRRANYAKSTVAAMVGIPCCCTKTKYCQYSIWVISTPDTT